MKEAHLRRRKKNIYRAEQLHRPTTSTEEKLSSTERNVPQIWGTVQLKLPTKTKNSTMESNLTRRIIAQREVHYCQSTATDCNGTQDKVLANGTDVSRAG